MIVLEKSIESLSEIDGQLRHGTEEKTEGLILTLISNRKGQKVFKVFIRLNGCGRKLCV